MRPTRALIPLLLSLLLASGLQAQRVTHFAVNGQVCQEDECVVELGSAGYGRPLRLSLVGERPSASAIDFLLTYTPSGVRPVRGVMLEFSGHSINLGQGMLRVPRQSTPSLWGGGAALYLHLGEITVSTPGIVTVKAFVRGAAAPFAVVSVRLEGLKTPGENPPWRDEGQFNDVRPHVVPIYPNPVKSGPVHIDLQGIPADKKGQVSVLDLLGGTVFSTPFVGGAIVECPADGLSKGIYFVRIDVEGIVLYTGRLVIDR